MKLAIREKKEVARPLHVLVPLIKKDLSVGETYAKQSFERYASAGGKLKEARKQVPARDWAGWLRDNFNRARAQADRYIAAHEHMLKGRVFESIKEMERHGQRKKKFSGIPKDIRRIMDGIDVDVEELNETDIPEKAEVGLVRELMNKVVQAGYRAVSTKLHPDKGGSDEAMRRLNLVRDMLLEFAKEGMLLLHE